MSKILDFFKGQSRSATVKKNAAGSLLIKGFSIVFSLMLIPLTISYVSSEVYGIWLTLSSIIIWFGILDAGFSLGLKNKLANMLALNRMEEARAYISTTYATMVAIFIPVCIIMLFVVNAIDWTTLLNIAPQYGDDVVRALYAIVLCFCIQMVLGVINAVLAANQMVAVTSLIYFIGNATSLVTIFVLTLVAPPSLFVLSVCQACIPVIVFFIASIFLFITKLKHQRPSFKLISKKHVANLFDLGYKFFILQIQVLVVGQTTNFLVSYVSGPIDVTSYNIAYRYIGIAFMSFLIITEPLWPAFTDAFAKKDFRWMNNTYKNMSKVRIAFEVFIIILILMAPLVYHIWIGDKTIIPMSMTIAVGIYFMAQLWMSLNITLINGIGCIQLQTYLAIFVSVVHIPLSVILGNCIGAIGVVVSLIVLNLLYAIVSQIQIRKVLSSTATGIWTK
ncbi:MAG: hypothetical protein IJ588_06840 [Prevotella sp.]|nr:hypothetical protein [Prevotella sp.]